MCIPQPWKVVSGNREEDTFDFHCYSGSWPGSWNPPFVGGGSSS